MRGSRSSTWLAVGGALLALGSFGSSAHAQDCTSDDECEAGSTCKIYASGGTDTDCAPDAGGCESETVEYGECRPKPITCKQDSDCPTDLTCVTETEHSGDDDGAACTDRADGGIDCDADEKPEPSAPQCEFLWTECKKDGDCEAGHYCMVVEVKQCDDPGSACPPGADCPTPPEDEPTCATVREDRVCFPKRVDCTSDAQCQKGWQCYDVSDGKSEAPSGWEGAEQVCFPDGFVLVLQDKAPVGNGLSDDASADDKGGSGAQSNSDADSDDGDDAADTSKAAASDDGCSVSDVSHDTRSGTAVLFAVLGAVLAGRRRVRSRSRREI